MTLTLGPIWFLWGVSAIVGLVIGNRKDRLWAGIWWGALLGPLGIICAIGMRSREQLEAYEKELNAEREHDDA